MCVCLREGERESGWRGGGTQPLWQSVPAARRGSLTANTSVPCTKRVHPARTSTNEGSLFKLYLKSRSRKKKKKKIPSHVGAFLVFFVYLFVCVCVVLPCIVMALKKVNSGDICERSSVAETAVQCLLSAERFRLPDDLRLPLPLRLGGGGLGGCRVFKGIGGGGGGAALALQHVVVALVVVVISVVIEVRTVIGGRDQGEGPFVVLGVQRLLLNADVVPGRGDKESRE